MNAGRKVFNTNCIGKLENSGPKGEDYFLRVLRKVCMIRKVWQKVDWI